MKSWLLIGTSMGIMAFNNKPHVPYILHELKKRVFIWGFSTCQSSSVVLKGLLSILK
jgi:hypothetical protein